MSGGRIPAATRQAVLSLTQVFAPLLRKSTAARIVKVSSGLGALNFNSTPNPYGGTSNRLWRSKTALNAIPLALPLILMQKASRSTRCPLCFASTTFTTFEGTETVEQSAAEAVHVTLLGSDGASKLLRAQSTSGFSNAQPADPAHLICRLPLEVLPKAGTAHVGRSFSGSMVPSGSKGRRCPTD